MAARPACPGRACAVVDQFWLCILLTCAEHTPRRAPAGLPATKKPFDATVAAGSLTTGAQPARASQAAEEEASDAPTRPGRVQELLQLPTRHKANTAVAHKVLDVCIEPPKAQAEWRAKQEHPRVAAAAQAGSQQAPRTRWLHNRRQLLNWACSVAAD